MPDAARRIERGALVGVFAVTEGGSKRVGDAQRGVIGLGGIGELDGSFGGFRRGDSLQRVGDGRVVGGGHGKGLLREPPAGLARKAAGVRGQLLGDGRVVGDGGDDGHVFKVLGGGADHRRPADVDVLDDLGDLRRASRRSSQRHRG